MIRVYGQKNWPMGFDQYNNDCGMLLDDGVLLLN